MEISIFLTILLIIISLGGEFCQRGKICLIRKTEMDFITATIYDLMKSLLLRVVKLLMRGLDMLNTVVLLSTQKAIQTTLIQTHFYKFQG